MNEGKIFKILGLLSIFYSITFLPPILVDLLYQETASATFFYTFFLIFTIGIVLWWPFKNHPTELKPADGFLIVTVFWIFSALAGALPFILNTPLHIHAVDAIFESVSGITTTGSTVFINLDTLPHAFNYHRHQLSFIGGLGIVIFALAVLPVLGIGGFQLFRAETSGPIKNQKLTPKIKETIQRLWFIYVGITFTIFLLFKLAGMSWFDALNHSFSAVSTGGFSTHDSNLGFYKDQLPVLWVACLGMFLGTLNFYLHYQVLIARNLKHYWQDTECRTFILLMFCSIFLVWGGLKLDTIAHVDTLTHSALQVVSFMTTTGFSSDNYSLWPGAIPIFLFLLTAIGGCAGSTSGGLKMIRWILIQKQGLREIHRLIHPRATFPIKLQEKVVSETVMRSVFSFLGVYMAVFVVFLLILLHFEKGDLLTAYSTLISCLSNSGPGLGKAAADFHTLTEGSKWTLCAAMIIGRLEIFTVLVLLSPLYWKK